MCHPRGQQHRFADRHECLLKLLSLAFRETGVTKVLETESDGQQGWLYGVRHQCIRCGKGRGMDKVQSECKQLGDERDPMLEEKL